MFICRQSKMDHFDSISPQIHQLHGLGEQNGDSPIPKTESVSVSDITSNINDFLGLITTTEDSELDLNVVLNQSETEKIIDEDIKTEELDFVASDAVIIESQPEALKVWFDDQLPNPIECEDTNDVIMDSDVDEGNPFADDDSDIDQGNEIISDCDDNELEKDGDISNKQGSDAEVSDNESHNEDGDKENDKSDQEDRNPNGDDSAPEFDDDTEMITFDDPADAVDTEAINEEAIEEKDKEVQIQDESDEQSQGEEIEQEPLKKRRRIILLSDDEDDAAMKEENITLGEFETENLNLSSHSNDEAMLDDTLNLPIAIESSQLAENERPKPKCFKESTKTIKQLQARHLMDNAVIIPAPNTYGRPHKNKTRALESDDEEKEEKYTPVDTMDDIGRIGDVVDTKSLRYISERKEIQHSDSSESSQATNSSSSESEETKKQPSRVLGTIKLVKVENLMEKKQNS